MGAKESGQSFIAGVLAKLPEADRAAVQAIFAKPEAEQAVILVGEGALARPDYSKAMDDVTKLRTEVEDRQAALQDWFTNNETALKDYLVIKPEYDKLKGTPLREPIKTGDAPVFDPKALDEQLEQRDRAFAGALSLTVRLVQEHGKMFPGEILDTDELLADNRLGRPIAGQPGRVFGIRDAYQAKFGEKISVELKKAEDARIDKLVQDRLVEERRKNPTQPFPIRDASPSPLDALNVKDGPAQHTIDTAIAEYDRLQAARAT